MKKLFSSRSSVKAVENLPEEDKTSAHYTSGSKGRRLLPVICNNSVRRQNEPEIHSSGYSTRSNESHLSQSVTTAGIASGGSPKRGYRLSDHGSPSSVRREKAKRHQQQQVVTSTINKSNSQISQTYQYSEQQPTQENHDINNRKKAPPRWLTRNPSLRQRSHSINVVQGSNRSFSADDNESCASSSLEVTPQNDKQQMDPTYYNRTSSGTSSVVSIRRPRGILVSDSKSSPPTSVHSLKTFRSTGGSGLRTRRLSVTSSTSSHSSSDDNVPRLVFIGDQCVGKTALINRFVKGSFVDQRESMVSPVAKHTKYVYYASIGKFLFSHYLSLFTRQCLMTKLCYDNKN